MKKLIIGVIVYCLTSSGWAYDVLKYEKVRLNPKKPWIRKIDIARRIQFKKH
jgi:hypothetical protein